MATIKADRCLCDRHHYLGHLKLGPLSTGGTHGERSQGTGGGRGALRWDLQASSASDGGHRLLASPRDYRAGVHRSRTSEILGYTMLSGTPC